MARFVYRMQSVLNIKQQTENQTKMEFALAQAELNKQLDILQEYIDRKAAYLQEAEELRNEPALKLQEILDNQYATAQMDVMIASQAKVVAQHEEIFEKVRGGIIFRYFEKISNRRARETKQLLYYIVELQTFQGLQSPS